MADEEAEALLEAGLGEDAVLGSTGGGGGGGTLGGGEDEDDPTFIPTGPRFLTSRRLVLLALAVSAVLCGAVYWTVSIVERQEGIV